MKLKINPLIVVDSKHIRDYIAENIGEAAQRMVTEIYDAFEILPMRSFIEVFVGL